MNQNIQQKLKNYNLHSLWTDSFSFSLAYEFLSEYLTKVCLIIHRQWGKRELNCIIFPPALSQTFPSHLTESDSGQLYVASFLNYLSREGRKIAKAKIDDVTQFGCCVTLGKSQTKQGIIIWIK